LPIVLQYFVSPLHKPHETYSQRTFALAANFAISPASQAAISGTMNMPDASVAATTADTITVDPHRVLKRIALIALCAIALGFLMQGLILVVKLSAGAPFPGARFIVDLAQGVTWSFLVCAGVGIGTSIMKARAALVGLLAMACAPLAIAMAKSSQKVMASVVGVADQPAVLSLATISGLRAIEYGLLGWWLGTLARREVSHAAPYLKAGASLGVFFGGAIAALTYQVALSKGLSPAPPQILSSIVNEVAFPIGCAFVIYVGQLVSGHLKLADK
jgi:hypothetical protein